MGESARFSVPLAAARPRGSRLIEGFSPKLGPRLRCFGRHAFEQWMRLEADPNTLTFCERPLCVDQGKTERIVDFWMRSRNEEALLVIGEEYPVPQMTIGGVSLPIRSVALAELAAARVWIANWERMLPCIVAFRLNAHLLDAPFRCANCRAYYGCSAPPFADRKPLPLPARVALTQTCLRFAL